MKTKLIIAGALLLSLNSKAQKFDFLEYQKSGTFSKPTILKGMKQIAIAQNTVIFKTISTRDLLKNERNAIGGRKSGGASVKAKVSAYLEFSDSEPTIEDYQKLTDDFHAYLNQKFAEAGITNVDWNTISNHNFYTSNNKDKDKEESPEVTVKSEHGYYMVNANHGNTLIKYRPFGTGMNVGFAFGKAKKAADFTEDVNAPVIYMHTVVDFCDLDLSASVKTEKEYGYTKITTLKKYKADGSIAPNVKIAGWSNWNGTNMGGRIIVTEKMKTDTYMFNNDIASGVRYANEVVQDESKMNKKKPLFGLSMAKKMDLIPVAVVTTKAQYMLAAKKALENFADQWVAQINASKA
ncbi:MAG TPA: hypothetical protein PLU07_06245 [Ferruginibacter sp.]|nr:hypothetical protein [Ferruginibacter sp.]HRO17767.1 hypothetical protein [Ferruginibacter sp.]